MKEKPILFSTPMVQGINDDRKIVTRRTVGLEFINADPDDWQFEWFDYRVGFCFTRKSTVNEESLKNNTFNQVVIKCRYGLKGDILWVRETWGWVPTGKGQTIGYRATHKGEMWNKWKPSIHMPKDICRIRLDIQSISVERLHDITEEDAIREGVERIKSNLGILKEEYEKQPCWQNYSKDKRKFYKPTARESFITLWIAVNGGGSWLANPWVWRIEFKKQ